MDRITHNRVRTFLRAVGPVALVVGGLLAAVGFVTFAGARPDLSRSGPPPGFLMFVFGGFLFVAGMAMVKWGYLGAFASYGATEVSPALETGAGAVAKGLNQGLAGDARTCPGCGADNDPDARFCDDCGTALAVACPDCGEVNDADARFCDDCGTALSA